LTEALKCAQRAVKLDLAKSDLPLAVAAYDEAIAILQRVIARRSQKPGITSEVERVTSIVSQHSSSLPSPAPAPAPSLCHLEPSALTIKDYCSRGVLFFSFCLFVLLVFVA
jgi:hypothetical protein